MDAAYAAFVAKSGEAASHTRGNSEERTLLLTQKPSHGNIMGMKITVLDAVALGEDLDLSPLNAVGDVTVWNRTAPDEVRTRITDCDAVILNKVRIGDEQLPAPGHAPRILCVAATGYDNIDIAACRARRIAVANVRGYSTDSVAQVTVGLVLALVSHLPTYCVAVSDGTYSRSGQANLLTPPYRELAGMTWGILGAGQIGSRVAGVARAFGCRVLTCRRHPDGSSVSLETLLRESDIVTIHTPLTEETRGMIGAEQFAQMKPTAMLINTARGPIVDEAALIDALTTGKIATAGLDTYEREPLPKDHPLLTLDNVVASAHAGGNTKDNDINMVNYVYHNIVAFDRGEPLNTPGDIVNGEYLKK